MNFSKNRPKCKEDEKEKKIVGTKLRFQKTFQTHPKLTNWPWNARDRLETWRIDWKTPKPTEIWLNLVPKSQRKSFKNSWIYRQIGDGFQHQSRVITIEGPWWLYGLQSTKKKSIFLCIKLLPPTTREEDEEKWWNGLRSRVTQPIWLFYTRAIFFLRHFISFFFFNFLLNNKKTFFLVEIIKKLYLL